MRLKNLALYGIHVLVIQGLHDSGPHLISYLAYKVKITSPVGGISISDHDRMGVGEKRVNRVPIIHHF